MSTDKLKFGEEHKIKELLDRVDAGERIPAKEFGYLKVGPMVKNYIQLNNYLTSKTVRLAVVVSEKEKVSYEKIKKKLSKKKMPKIQDMMFERIQQMHKQQFPEKYD